MEQLYDEHDVARLRTFLSQPSAESGKTNGEQLDLTAAEVSALITNKSWVGAVYSVSWTKDTPQRLSGLGWSHSSLAGKLDLSGCTAMSCLRCPSNSLTSLDVSGCKALTELYCEDSQLTELNVSDCTSLDKLICQENRFSSLDVSECRALIELSCEGCQLTELNVRGCSELEILYCEDNKLVALNLKHNTALRYLYCYSNQLTTLDVRNNTKLEKLNFSGSSLTDMFVGWLKIPKFTSLSLSGDVSNSTLHVPVGTVPLYRSANIWNMFGKIVEYPAESSDVDELLPEGVELSCSNGVLMVESPKRETITVSSIVGRELYFDNKPSGRAVFDISHLLKGIILVKGSSGWRKKLFR